MTTAIGPSPPPPPAGPDEEDQRAAIVHWTHGMGAINPGLTLSANLGDYFVPRVKVNRRIGDHGKTARYQIVRGQSRDGN